jgi:alkylhydroperoxidase/carboxymuconolactone decarboxylase family protein YurZ
MMSAEKNEVRDAVVAANRGPFTHWWEALWHVDHRLLKRVHEYLAAAENGGPVTEKMRHLIWTTVDTVVTHLYPRGAGVHARLALETGATVREVIEAISIATTVSNHSYGDCLEIVVKASGGPPGPAGTMPLVAVLREQLGWWEPWMDIAAQVAPEHLRATIQLHSPDRHQLGLDAKSRELILMAGYACPAINHHPAVKRHAERAVAAGASQAELVQTVQLATGIGLHAISEGVMAACEHFATPRN